MLRQLAVLSLLWLLPSASFGCESIARPQHSVPCGSINCVNGDCRHPIKSGLDVCICDVGWAGDACDRCCACAGSSCQIGVDNVTYCDGVTTTPQTPPATTTSTLCSAPKASNSMNCFSKVCRNAVGCEITESPFQVNCVCLDGWGGELCDHCCDPPCPNSSCEVDQHGVQQRCTEWTNSIGSGEETEWTEATTGAVNVTALRESACNATRKEEFELCPLSELECYHGNCNATTMEVGGNWIIKEECVCLPLWGGISCDQCCDLPCVNGYCSHHEISHQQSCSCNLNYTGDLCETMVIEPTMSEPIEKSTTPGWFWYVVGFGSLLVLGLAMMLIVGLCYIYHNRETIIGKLMRYFQKFEDDDGKLFDAFVSYRGHPDDESFVVHQLRVELEIKRDFKLCLHFRDFVPGAPIADNILWAVQQSRRTILLISPAYLTGEWPKLEYQAAQHEMLKSKARIIPVIFKDISAERKDMDRILRNILDSTTYLEWPGQDTEHPRKEARFWKRLELAMPKKKVPEASEGIAHGVLDKNNGIELNAL